MTHKRLALSVSALALLLGIAAPADALTFTCSTVARKGTLDPSNGEFGTRYDSPGINAAGDVVFFAHAKRAPRRLYLYPNAAAPSIIAGTGDGAPGGSAYKTFREPSINDAGDLAFHAKLAIGEGVFQRPAAGAVAKVAMTTDASPGGGVFEKFPAVSRVNAAGNVAFIGRVSSGADGVFLYDATLATVATVGLVGDLTLEGRQLCELIEVGLGATGTVAIHAMTKVSCADPMEAEIRGIYRHSGLLFSKVLEEGDATPIGGTTYDNFIGAPDVNASDKVMVRARTTGVVGVVGIFLTDPVGPTTTTLAATGNFAPGGGSLKSLAPGGVTDGDRAGIGARIASGTAKTGIFLFGAGDEAVVRDGDLAPNDQFGPNSFYTKINPGNRKTNEEVGVDRSGTWLAYTARVYDTIGPPGKAGLFRCNGS